MSVGGWATVAVSIEGREKLKRLKIRWSAELNRDLSNRMVLDAILAEAYEDPEFQRKVLERLRSFFED